MPNEICPDCGREDKLQVNDDGSSYCHSSHCKVEYTFPDGNKIMKNGDLVKANNTKVMEIVPTTERPVVKSFVPVEGTTRPLPSRALSSDTAKFWDYQIGKAINPMTKQMEDCHIANYKNENNAIIGQQLRFAPITKTDKVTGKTKSINSFATYGDCTSLYGKHLWTTGRKIIITEGQLDALSISQVQKHKYPVVSLPNGVGSALKVIKKDLRWLEENFEEIILMFDNDAPGSIAVSEVAPLFAPGTCRIAKLPLKDASDMLVAGRVSEMISAVFNGTIYRPDGVVTVEDLIDRIGEKPSMGLSTCFPSLDSLAYGLKPSELDIWTSGSGMGKTEVFKSLAAHLMRKHKQKVGLIFFEEQAPETVVKMAGKLVSQRFDSPEYEFKIEDRDAVIDVMRKDNLLYMNDKFAGADYNALKSMIRYLVITEEVKYIFLDHITAFTDGLGGSDANQLMEKLMKELATMTRELDFHLSAISHIRKTGGGDKSKSAEDGGRITMDDMKGSGAIKQWANNIFALERNMSTEEELERNVSTIRLLKVRDAGQNIGRYFKVKYEPSTGELTEQSEFD